MRRILNTLFRLGMRLLMPDLAKQMDQEGLLTLDPAKAAGENPEFLRVEDNGADLTIFVFSGLDVLYAGLARFEFQGTLRHLDRKANLVFVRDVHRLCFHVQPDGTPGGLAFFEAEISAVKERLGATQNIAVGSSIGGSAAFYFGTRCQMDQVVLFGAAFEVDCFTAPRMVARTVFDVRKLFTEPRAYVEMLVVTLSAVWGSRQLTKRFGHDGLMNPLEEYRRAQPRPRVSLFYGKTAWPDARQAQLLRDIDSNAALMPLPTGRHNTPSFLKQRGELGQRLAEAIARA
jgi:pimeloyl-ACP methyl ester carboxylesterase